MADSKAANGVWFVRGVAVTLRADVAAAAKRAGMRVGPWTERALRAALAGSDGAVTDPVVDLVRRLQGVDARLERLERAGVSTVEGGGEVADAPETMEPSDWRRRPRRFKPHRPWTDEDDAVLRRITREGGIQADAQRELQRRSSTISFKWKSLGLPVAPLKGRKYRPRQKRTA